MKKIIEWVTTHVDKTLHFICTYAFTISAFLFSGNMLFSAILSLMAGLLKEAYDENSYGGWSWLDLIADIIGILTAICIIGLSILIKELFYG